MRDCFATKIISIVLMVLTPAAMLMAETSNTMLYARGTVLLNGADVASSAPVVPGDKIDTAGSTAVTVDHNGSKVTVNPYSSLSYEADGVKVFRGGATVETNEGMTAKVSQITVAPVDKTATYEIARLNNKVTITSHTGALMITDAGTTSTLEPGASSTLNADPTQTPAPAPAAQPFPHFPGSDVPHKKLIAIGLVVGGIAAACGLWCGTNPSNNPPNGFTVTPHVATSAANHHAARPTASVPALQRVAAMVASHPAVAQALVNGMRQSARASVAGHVAVNRSLAQRTH